MRSIDPVSFLNNNSSDSTYTFAEMLPWIETRLGKVVYEIVRSVDDFFGLEVYIVQLRKLEYLNL